MANEEVELKLLADEGFDDAVLLQNLESVAQVGSAKTGIQRDVYVDTARDELRAAGLSARIRHKGEQREVEVKPVPIDPALVMRRAEFGRTVASGEDPLAVLSALLRSEIGLPLQSELEPRFELSTERTRRRIELAHDGGPGGPIVVELAVDRVSVAGADGEGRFVEVELETLEGGPHGLEELYARARATPGLSPSGISKAVRARTILDLPGYEYRAPAPSFERKTPIVEVARAIGAQQLALIQSYEPGTRVGVDTEHLHKMRVATRRLRTALRVFRKALPASERQPLGDELKWLARLLGEVRDLDVHLLALPDWRARFGRDPERGWDELEQLLTARRNGARQRLLQGLGSRRYAALLERASELFAPREGEGDVDSTPVGKAAVKILGKRVTRFEDAVARFRKTHDPEDAHQLRIVAKRLRYAAEFLRPILTRKTRERIKKLSSFQDELGSFQDAVQAGLLARQLAGETLPAEAPEAAFALGMLAGAAVNATEMARPLVDQALERLEPDPLLTALAADAKALGDV